MTAPARPNAMPPVRKVSFGRIEPQGHRVGFFGPGGIGKTTLAMTAPGPVGVIDLDDSLPILLPSLGKLDVRRVAGIAGNGNIYAKTVFGFKTLDPLDKSIVIEVVPPGEKLPPSEAIA